jgi:2-keto-4-pentenoate hydratase/2-oxohepta-3-ene-1,7-dioic acid hydratase in catechol pathway
MKSVNKINSPFWEAKMDKIICVGKNYLEHAKELGEAVPESPVFFLKPPSVLKKIDKFGEKVSLPLPRGRGSIHPECEIVCRIDSRGKIDAISLGLDLTLREVQAELKKKGHPWEISKVFIDSAVVGPWVKIEEFPKYLEEEFIFSVNGQVRQKGFGKDMRVSPEACLKAAQKFFSVCAGDFLFTGTPAGVSAVEAGQIAEISWGSQLFFQVQFV